MNILAGYFLYAVGGLFIVSAMILGVYVERSWSIWVGLLLFAVAFFLAYWAETFVVPLG